jgi:hypothetical protein
MNFHFSKNGWLILGTALIIGVAFSIYFLVYVKNREKALIENNFRVLQQIRENINAQENYFKNAKDCNYVPNDRLTCNYETDGISLVYGPEDSFSCDTVSYQEFFDNDLLTRKDVFDYIIVSKYKDEAGSGKREREILYTNAPGNVADSVFQKENLSSFFELTIAADQYVSFNQNIENNLYISGLVNQTVFARQKRGVSLFVIIVFSVLLVFIILNMPLIKMKIMSRTESLNATDVVLSGTSILLGSGVLLILLLSGLIYFVSERKKTHEYLEDLSYKLETRFNQEMSNIIYQLNDIRDQFPLNASIRRVANRRNLHLANQSINSKFSQMVDQEEEKYDIDGYRMYHNVLAMQDNSPAQVFSFYSHFNYIFWCDSSARALIFLTPFKNPVYVQDLRHRKYLTNVIDGSTLNFRDMNSETKLIGFESIKSVNDGTYEVGIGIISGDTTLPILAMSTKLMSVMDPILPEGYGFCILDEEGNTVFHSSIQKNMNENFINETLQTFLPALKSQTETFKSVTYGKQIHMIHFRPMTSIPKHYLATFTSEESYNTPYSLALYNSLLLFLGFLIIMALIYLIFYSIVYQENKLLRSGFLFDWLRPFETPVHHVKYRKLLRLNLLTILYLLVSSRMIWYERDILVNNLLLTTAVLLICSFWFLYISIPNEIRLTSHLTRSDGRRKYFRIIYLASGMLIVLLLLVNRFTLILNYSGTGLVFWKEMIILLINLGLLYAYIHQTGIYQMHAQLEKADAPSIANPKSNIPVLYQGYLFTWVIILSIIPIHIFFGMSYDLEKEILIKYNASQTFAHYNEWERLIDGEFRNNFNPDDYSLFKNSMKEDGFHLQLPLFVNIESSGDKVNHPFTGRKILFDSIYGKVRPFYNQLSFLSNGFVADHALDTSWQATRDPTCLTSLFPRCRKLTFTSGDVSLEYEMSGFFDLFRSGWRIILLLMPAALLVYFKLIQFSTKRIYGFKFKKYADALVVKSTAVNEYIDDLCSSEHYNHLFNVSLDTLHSSRASETANNLQNTKCFICKLDFYDLGKKPVTIRGKDISIRFDESGDFLGIQTTEGNIDANQDNIEAFFNKHRMPVIILIDHFEHEFKNPMLNQLKYRILNYLSGRPEIRLVIFSAINMLTFFDFYRNSMQTFENRLSKKTAEPEYHELKNTVHALDIEISKWQILLGKFIEIVTPLKKNEFLRKADEHSDYLLEEELSYGKYLFSQYPLLKKFKSLDNSPDDMVYRTQQVSNTYYFAQWSMLSKDEKMLVFDIARNKFVNTKDSTSIFNLLNKGIFIYDHSLRTMNESYSNFVLSRMSNDEIMEKEFESRKKGAWNTTFIILLLVIVSLVIFLSVGQLSFLNDINSLFTSLGALLAIIVRFGGFFSPVPK